MNYGFGFGGVIRVHDDIPPGGSLAFTVRPNPPLPVRSDGHFETSVDGGGGLYGNR